MSLTNRALWAVDRNLGRPLTLSEIAGACGVSRHHLAHAFNAATGLPVMEYVRRRRLSEAAAALAAGASDILELALASGYASHEAFTRAFRAAFGQTPEAVRRRASVEGLALTSPLQLPEQGRIAVVAPALRSEGEIRAVGLVARRAFADWASITAQWRRFGPQIEAVEDKASPAPIGVLSAADDEGGFDYACAVEVLGFDRVPLDLARIVVPPQVYAVFQHAGHVSRIGETYTAILEDWLPNAGRALADGPSLERHAAGFDVRSGEGGLSIWLPLQA